MRLFLGGMRLTRYGALVSRPNSRGAAGSSGFTIIETLVALGIFYIIGFTAINVFVVVQNSQRTDSYLDLAHSTAQRIVETARTGDYEALEIGQTYDMAAAVPSVLPSGTASMKIEGGISDRKVVHVEVGFADGLVTRKTKLTAVIGPEGL